MGINNLYKTLLAVFGDSYIYSKSQLENNRRTGNFGPRETFDNIYFDFNPLLYKATHSSRKANHLMQELDEEKSIHELKSGPIFSDTNNPDTIPLATRKVFYTILLDIAFRYINHFDARETLFFALDGPAPRGKLVTQKLRRYTNSTLYNSGHTYVSFASNEEDLDDLKCLTEEQKKYLSLIQTNIVSARNEKRAINSAWFTPGTTLMCEIDAILHHLGALMLSSPYFRMKEDLEVFVSPAEREGEGEFKIIEHIYTSEKNNPTKKIKKDLIISGDSDFVLYALNLPQNRHVTLVKDLPNIYQMYDLTELKRKIAQKFQTKSDEDLRRIITDLTLIFSFAGNDYLSKLTRYDLKIVMDAYLAFQTNSGENREYLVEHNMANPYQMKLNSKVVEIIFTRKIKSDPVRDSPTFDQNKGSPPGRYNLPTRTCLYFLISIFKLGRRECLFEEYQALDDNNFQVTVKIGESNIAFGTGSSKRQAFDNAFHNIFKFDYKELYNEVSAKTKVFESKEDFNRFLTFFYQEQVEKHKQTWMKEKGAKKAQVSNFHLVKEYLMMSTWFLSYLNGVSLGHSYYYKPKSSPSFYELVEYCKMQTEGKEDPFVTITLPQQTDDIVLNPLETCISACVSPLNKNMVPIEEVRSILDDSPVQHLFDVHDDIRQVLVNWTKEDALLKIREAVNAKLASVKNKEDYQHILQLQHTTKMNLSKDNHFHVSDLPAQSLLPNSWPYNPSHKLPQLKNIRFQVEAKKPHKVYVDSKAKKHHINIDPFAGQTRKFHTLLRLLK